MATIAARSILRARSVSSSQATTWAAVVIGLLATLLVTSPIASIIVTLWRAASVEGRGNHDVELNANGWTATSGGFDRSPAVSTCVRPNDVSTSDSATGIGAAASAASYSWQYASRTSCDRNADMSAIAL